MTRVAVFAFIAALLRTVFPKVVAAFPASGS
jgi:hypothetical protein